MTMNRYIPKKGYGAPINGAESIPETDGSFKPLVSDGASRGGLSMGDMKRGHTASKRIDAKSDPVDPA